MAERNVYHDVGQDPHYKTWHVTGENLIIYMHSDGGSIVCGEKIYPIKKGVLCFIGAKKYHFTMPDEPEIYDRSKVFFSSERLENIHAMLPSEHPFRNIFTEDSLVYAQISEEVQDEVEFIFKELYELKSNERYKELLIMSSCIKLFVHLDRFFVESAPKASNLMQRAILYMNQHVLQEIKIDDICAALHMSKYNFCRRFKKTTGITVMEYILKTRLVIAKSYLLKGNSSISEISDKCGFSSLSYFCRVFKEDTGKTPLQYRKGQGM